MPDPILDQFRQGITGLPLNPPNRGPSTGKFPADDETTIDLPPKPSMFGLQPWTNDPNISKYLSIILSRNPNLSGYVKNVILGPNAEVNTDIRHDIPNFDGARMADTNLLGLTTNEVPARISLNPRLSNVLETSPNNPSLPQTLVHELSHAAGGTDPTLGGEKLAQLMEAVYKRNLGKR